MERNLVRLRQAVEQSQEDHMQKLDAQWISSVPDQYRGHYVKEIIGGTVKNSVTGLETKFDAGWDGSLTASDVDKIREYLDEPTKFAILRGSAGTGKSTMAATLARKLIHVIQTSGCFVTSVTMLNEFSFKSEENPVKHYSSFGILVIDDIGAVNESLTAHQQKSLWNLIESRWSNRDKYTIFTTNMAMQDNAEGIGLSSWIGESGWDRIISDLTRITMTGESFRHND